MICDTLLILIFVNDSFTLKRDTSTDGSNRFPETIRRGGCEKHTQCPECIQYLGRCKVCSCYFVKHSRHATSFLSIDCDEVFNYWEPMHYIQYGRGMQTWEYSPEFSIRSWAYILAHSIVAIALELFVTDNKVGIILDGNVLMSAQMKLFFAFRTILGLISASVETFFYSAIVQNIHPTVGLYCLIFLVLSPGMFIASPSFLPSTFAMYCITAAFAWGLQKRSWKGSFAVVGFVGLGSLFGWPFAGVFAIPFVLEALIGKSRWTELKFMVMAGIFVLLLVLVIINWTSLLNSYPWFSLIKHFIRNGLLSR